MQSLAGVDATPVFVVTLSVTVIFCNAGVPVLQRMQYMLYHAYFTMMQYILYHAYNAYSAMPAASPLRLVRVSGQWVFLAILGWFLFS